jgi:hypothetical protein
LLVAKEEEEEEEEEGPKEPLTWIYTALIHLSKLR